MAYPQQAMRNQMGGLGGMAGKSLADVLAQNPALMDRGNAIAQQAPANAGIPPSQMGMGDALMQNSTMGGYGSDAFTADPMGSITGPELMGSPKGHWQDRWMKNYATLGFQPDDPQPAPVADAGPTQSQGMANAIMAATGGPRGLASLYGLGQEIEPVPDSDLFRQRELNQGDIFADDDGKLTSRFGGLFFPQGTDRYYGGTGNRQTPGASQLSQIMNKIDAQKGLGEWSMQQGRTSTGEM
jgi:hypothetical protein